MTSNDPRVFLVPTGLPPGVIGRLFVCVTSPRGDRASTSSATARSRSTRPSTSPSSCADQPHDPRRAPELAGTRSEDRGMWSPEGRKQKAEELKASADKVLRYRQLADRFFGYFQPDSDNGRQLKKIKHKLDDLRARASTARSASPRAS
jgi:hypothetical protein